MAKVGDIFKNVAKTTIKIAAFPITGTLNIYKTVTTKGVSDNKKIAAIMFNIMGIYLWGLIANCGLSLLGALNIISLGGTTSTLIANKQIDLTKESIQQKKKEKEKKESPTGVNSGAVLQDENGNWILDLSKISDDVTTNLPQGTYQSGTAKQRAELLMLFQEICSRPEVDIPVDVLCGFFYNESSAYLGNYKGSIFTAINQNQAKDVDSDTYGSFCISLSEWNAGEGHAFISKYDPTNTTGKTQVYSYSEAKSKGLKIGNYDRPNIFYLPDAAYSTALRVSNAYHQREGTGVNGLKYCKELTSKYESMGANAEQLKTIRYYSACASYNGWSDIAKGVAPTFYWDLTKQKGSVDQWWQDGNNKDSLRKTFLSLLDQIDRTVPNLIDVSYGANDPYSNVKIYPGNQYYSNLPEITCRYFFYVANGGRWVYEGLVANAKALGAMQSSSTLGGTEDFISNLKKLKAYGAEHDWSYSQSTADLISIDGTTVCTRHDCSGLVYAALYLSGYVKGNTKNDIWGSSSYGGSNSVLESQGWTHYTYSSSFKLQPGDIYAVPGSHVEVCAGDNTAYNWGDTKFFKTASPTGKTITPTHVWRPPAKSKTNTKTGQQMKNVSSGQQTVVNAAMSQLNKKQWTLYGTTMDSTNTCQAFTKRCWAEAGYGFNGFIYPKEFFEYQGSEYYVERYVPIGSSNGIPAEQIDWKTIPVGAGIISKGNYNGITPVHISTYIGDGEIIEAGASTVQRVPIGKTCGGNSIFGWVAPTKLYEEAKGKK